MYHKVLVKLADLLLDERFAVVRFNTRGTGKSTGPEMDDGRGAREDLETVFQWVVSALPDTELWAAGYSFGAYVALSSLVPGVQGGFPGRFPVKGVVAVAYPAGMPSYILKELPETKTVFIHGTEDSLIPSSTLKSYLKKHPTGYAIQWVAGANHFFDGKLDDLKVAARSGLKAMGCIT